MRNYLLFVFLIALLSCRTNSEDCPNPGACDDEMLRFAVVGDWGVAGAGNQAKVAEAMNTIANQCPYDFIISVGDNFYPSGVSSTQDPQWQASFESIYSGSGLFCPWYVVLGNHDYKEDVDAEIAYSQQSSRWTMPSRYFSKSFYYGLGNHADFYFLDTNPYQEDLVRSVHASPLTYPDLIPSDTLGQTHWLDSLLTRSTANWKIVVGHHPVYTCGLRKNQRQYIAKLKPMMERNDVAMYLAGHEHDLQIHHPDSTNTRYVVCGAGGIARPINAPFEFTDFAAGRSGFMVFELSNEVMHIQVFNENAELLYEERVSK